MNIKGENEWILKGGNKWILRVKMNKYQVWIRMNFKGENEWMNIKCEYK